VTSNYNSKVIIFGGDSEIGYRLYELFKKKNYDVIVSTKKIIKNKNFFYLNYSNLKKFNHNLKKITKNRRFDYVLFIAAITNLSNQIDNKKSIFRNLGYKNFKKVLEVNCFAPIKIFEILKKNHLIKPDCKVVFFSSLAGSIGNRGSLKHNKPFGNLIYRISKAALNCGVKNLSYDFSKKNIIISIHPGYVRTKNGGAKADLSINYACRKLFKTITTLTYKNSGKFLNYDGKKIKW
jgi:NAD(P)-dependent dehydrogenase (short-subunit alcohol dehydrogenase family)